MENCKAYLEVLQFLPQQYEALEALIKCFDLESMTATQNFISTENNTKITYKLHSYEDIRIDGYYWYGPIGYLNVEVEIIRDKIKSFELTIGKPFVEEIINIDLLNNNVVKIDRRFYEKGFSKRNISYYISDKLVSSVIYDTSFRHPKVEYKKFVENSSNQGGDRWIEIINERNYNDNTCTSENWDECKEISHNQFDRRFEGNLKRVRRFGRMPEKSKY